MTTNPPDILTARLYSYSDADRLANVSRGTSKRWIEGYSYKDAKGTKVVRPPITPGRPITGAGVSFSDLVEIVVIGRFKDLGFGVPKIRTVVSNCQELFREPYPLSTQKFKAGGRDIFVSEGSLLHSVLRRRGSVAWDDILGPFLDTLDYRDSFAYRWWPMGKNKPILIDPEYGFGLPVIAGSGVRTEIIRERVEVGDSVQQISYDFNVTAEEVEAAIQYELQRAA